MVLAALTLAALAACGRGDRSDVASADSLNRDLQLAPVDTSATLNDQPAADTATPAPPATSAPAPASAPKPKPKPKPAPAPAAPAPTPAAQPAPAAPAALSAGTALSLTTDAEIHSRKNKVGDEVTATVGKDIKDATGRTVIPAGSKVTLQVTAIAPSDSKSDTTGTLTLKPVSVVVNGQTQPIAASISGVHTKLVGRGVDGADAAKVGAGTAWRDSGPSAWRQHQGCRHRRHHRRRGGHAAGGRDQGSRRGVAGGHGNHCDAGPEVHGDGVS